MIKNLPLADLELALCEQAIAARRNGEVGKQAEELYRRIREELANRGVNADAILRNKRIRKPYT